MDARVLGSLRRLLLAGSGLTFLVIALLSVPFKHQVAQAYGLAVPTADAANQFRAVFLGFWLGLALLLFTAARRTDVPLLGQIAGAMITLQALARGLSLVLDGVPSVQFVLAGLGELFTGVAIVVIGAREQQAQPQVAHE